MAKIISKKTLSEVAGVRVTRMEIEAPDIAKKARAGEFIAFMVTEKSERVPLTIVEADPKAGIITLIFQEVGLSTKLLGRLDPGGSLYAIVGPLGHATEIKNYGNVIIVGGGVGIAEIYPVAKALKEAGNRVTTISEPGTIIGEMALLLGDKRAATLRAMNNVVVTPIKKSDLKDIAEKESSLFLSIAISIA
ncbi:MAG: cyclic nucleotide-binding domain-containing protein, partial [Candidatus Omnitrophica bacterium]|nr:cyclic nucleotide-binding domain-containing protein [Candidatus Omnitrophota bacterium]